MRRAGRRLRQRYAQATTRLLIGRKDNWGGMRRICPRRGVSRQSAWSNSKAFRDAHSRTAGLSQEGEGGEPDLGSQTQEGGPGMVRREVGNGPAEGQHRQAELGRNQQDESGCAHRRRRRAEATPKRRSSQPQASQEAAKIIGNSTRTAPVSARRWTTTALGPSRAEADREDDGEIRASLDSGSHAARVHPNRRHRRARDSLAGSYGPFGRAAIRATRLQECTRWPASTAP